MIEAPQALAIFALPTAGEIAGSRVIDLFASAASARFTGSLSIEPTHGAKVVFRIEAGHVTRWQSLDDHQFILESLAESLPPEQLEFVRRHAYEANLDEFCAAARLSLLTERALEWIHRAATLRLLRVLSEPRFRHRYVFAAGQDCFQGQDGYESSISPLWLISECLLSTENLSWCRERLLALGGTPLRLSKADDAALSSLVGKARRVIQILRARPESFETLSKIDDVPESVAIGTLYALLCTRAVEPIHESVAVPRSRESTAPARDEAPISQGYAPRFQVRGEGEWIRPVSESRPDSRLGSQSQGPQSQGPRVPESRAAEFRIPESRGPRSGGPVQEVLAWDEGPASGSRTGSSRVQTEPPHSTDRPTPAPRARANSSRPGAYSNVKPASNAVESTRPSAQPRQAAPTQQESRGESEIASRDSSRSPRRFDEGIVEHAALETWTRALGADREQLMRSEAQVERMANAFPDNANILFYLGALYHLTRKTFEAETTLLRVIDLDPDNIEARDELMRVRRTIEGDRRAAPGLFRRLVGKS